MERAVKLSYTAEKKLKHLFEILIEKWSVKVKNDFIRKLDKCIGIIKVFPYSFLESEKGLRKCVINKQLFTIDLIQQQLTLLQSLIIVKIQLISKMIYKKEKVYMYGYFLRSALAYSVKYIFEI